MCVIVLAAVVACVVVIVIVVALLGLYCVCFCFTFLSITRCGAVVVVVVVATDEAKFFSFPLCLLHFADAEEFVYFIHIFTIKFQYSTNYTIALPSLTELRQRRQRGCDAYSTPKKAAAAARRKSKSKAEQGRDKIKATCKAKAKVQSQRQKHKVQLTARTTTETAIRDFCLHHSQHNNKNKRHQSELRKAQTMQ